ncbi:MAG: sulfite exporter TauE/SafE family protein [Acidimicrobiales bacterium]
MDASPLRDALNVLLGLVTGMASGAFGVGGAIISTPGVRLLGAPALVAVGTTLPSILPGAVAATARYARDGLVDWRVVATAAPAGTAMAVAGSLASHAVPGDGHWLMVLSAVLLAVTAVRMAVPGERGPQLPRSPGHRRLAAIGVGTVAGLLSGLLGVGGGLVLVPGFTQVLGMQTVPAVATSLACVGILAIPSTIAHAALGDIDWRMATLLAVAVVPGARLGAAAALGLGDRRLRLAVAAVLGAVAVAYGLGELAAAVS